MFDQTQILPGGVNPSSPQLGPEHQRIPIYTREFADNPHHFYREMRNQYGGLVPVWIEEGVPATLVTKYQTAVKILHDPKRFPADPRRWQAKLPPGLELNVFPMMEYRKNALRNTGAVHERYRTAANDALAGVNSFALHPVVEQAATELIGGFPERAAADGSIDLMGNYFVPLVFSVVVNHILGCPSVIGERIAAASAAIFDAQMGRAEVNAMMDSALLELCELKRVYPGDDVTTRLVEHDQRLDDEELIQAQVTNCSAGIEITANLAANAMLLMLTDPRYDPYQQPGTTPPVNSAIDEILAADPPLANLCITYPPSPVPLEDAWLPADEPVIISMAACSSDPEYGAHRAANNSAHLAWGGPSPHSCPAQARTASYTIAADAITQLMDFYPELQLAVSIRDLRWRPGPFHRAIETFPVAVR